MADATESSTPRLAFIGGGNMARSLIGGLVRRGAAPARIAVAEPNAELRQALAADYGVAVHADGASAAADAEVVVLAVKPQVMRLVCETLRPVVQQSRPLLISIAAGIRMDQLDSWCGGNVAVVRSMPNTPALIGAGASGLCANARVTAEQRRSAEAVLGAAGLTVWIEAEEQMDIVTALSARAGVFLPAGRGARRRRGRSGPAARIRAPARDTDRARRRPHAGRGRRSAGEAARTRDVARRHDPGGDRAFPGPRPARDRRRRSRRGDAARA